MKNEWVQRIKMLRQSILSSSTDRRREAESQLMAIREAEAVGALLRVLGNDEAPMRILLSQVLSVIPEEQATLGLVKQILAEPSPTVRPIIFEKLKERDRPTVVRAALAGACDRADHGDQPGGLDSQQPGSRGSRSGLDPGAADLRAADRDGSSQQQQFGSRSAACRWRRSA